jgi:hypothetical protein
MDRQDAAALALILSAFMVAICSLPARADGNGDPQNQILIEARKERLRELTHDVAKSEDAFFDAYNRINTKRQFDVHCSVETATGTLISKRVCKPRFVVTARQNEASSVMESMIALVDGRIEPPHGESANQAINDQMRDYKEHLLEVVRNDENLRKMLVEYEMLKKRYDAALRDVAQ